MSDFMTIRDDRGHSIPPGIFAPSLIQKLCKEAYVRMLERVPAAKRGVKHCVCYDIIKESLSSKKFTALDKGRVRSFATEASDARARAQLGLPD